MCAEHQRTPPLPLPRLPRGGTGGDLDLPARGVAGPTSGRADEWRGRARGAGPGRLPPAGHPPLGMGFARGARGSWGGEGEGAPCPRPTPCPGPPTGPGKVLLLHPAPPLHSRDSPSPRPPSPLPARRMCQGPVWWWWRGRGRSGGDGVTHGPRMGLCPGHGPWCLPPGPAASPRGLCAFFPRPVPRGPGPCREVPGRAGPWDPLGQGPPGAPSPPLATGRSAFSPFPPPLPVGSERVAACDPSLARRCPSLSCCIPTRVATRGQSKTRTLTVEPSRAPVCTGPVHTGAAHGSTVESLKKARRAPRGGLRLPRRTDKPTQP